jgi:hypothetical protein
VTVDFENAIPFGNRRTPKSVALKEAQVVPVRSTSSCSQQHGGLNQVEEHGEQCRAVATGQWTASQTLPWPAVARIRHSATGNRFAVGLSAHLTRNLQASFFWAKQSALTARMFTVR